MDTQPIEPTRRGNETGDNHYSSFGDQHMDMRPLEPNQQLVATLSAQEWNAVMAALNELPHRIARPIWDKLGQQLQQQSQPQMQMSEE